MCGILGVINSGTIDRILVSKALGLLAKRGPDDFGEWQESGVYFGHRRLSVIDLAKTGHQPMVSFDHRFVIVFNGEIYNYKEVRCLLEPSVSNWNSDSDTEVILAAYAKWGTNCLKYFHGMFAFAIWDRKDKVLFAARDRMGIKPFYYHYSSSCFAFSSRPRSLFYLEPALSKEIDEQGLRFYLEAGYVPAPHSIYKDVRKLPPAHYLLVDKKGLRLERYWDYRHIQPELSWVHRSEEELLDELDRLVSRSVESRLISDVPLGAFLSGGIDSSLVVAIMAKRLSQPVKTFTIGFADKAYDESSHALAVAECLGTEHHCEHLQVNDLLQLLPTFQEEYDEPFFDSSAFPVMAVSRLARKHVTVSLSGDGGDELFGGYHYYQIAQKINHFFDLPPQLRSVITSLIERLPQHKFKLLSGALRQPDRASAFAFSRSIAKDFGGVLTLDLIERTKSIYALFSSAAEIFPRELHPSEQGMRLDAFYTLPDDYLQKVDVASMAFSLESRDPLLDQDLIEWAMKLPLQWKLRGGVNKYLLRKLAYRYVPQRILDRPKQGFGVPIDSWLRGPLESWAEDRLYDKTLFSKVPLDQSAVLALWKMHKSGKRNVHPLLWAILMFLNFFDRYGAE
ncbi:asparagine synthase (glutamine-hydrolyzing) [Oryzomonas sagensis]|uniref:asparagine synthase (glutamine-hydrolyzing) n=1 Tax=Oryzomonas sagensis TaxID=2603857 RepID=A0ABQ6TRJ0_9BACT|nr:asparagine synthase (glutamine-hydrolyzing) [Oryzomonas sagensis]KAB0671379.1 asparagine synthase (glutamine-hydrolyzing) [Oryzomonas sagensis]